MEEFLDILSIEIVPETIEFAVLEVSYADNAGGTYVIQVPSEDAPSTDLTDTESLQFFVDTILGN
jgi:hypothetical protein